MTAIWHLEHTAEDLLAGLNRDWRTRLRQAQKAGLRIERFDRPPVAEMAAMSDAMNTAKGVASAAVRESDVAAMFAALGETAVVYGCRDDSGTLLSFRSCAIHGSRAWDLMAATSADGRRLGASFAVLWELVLHCQRMGVTHYDLAGTDEAGAPGVASFKLRTGAEPLEWLSEWEWSTSPALRYAVGTLVRRRQAPSLP
jgi:lipid II:glycine glycyltransferase (peptidoglycan interpeptide bridge formation enzyme)